MPFLPSTLDRFLSNARAAQSDPGQTDRPTDRQTNRRADFRPVGAAAGAALPAKSLWDYVRHDYPAYKKLLEAAEDATLADGRVDMAKVLQKIKPGDYGVSGVQGSEDSFTNVLVHGSNSASGGVGAHGQIAGPNVKVDAGISRTPDGEMPPDLAFLKNDAGELHAPELAKDRKRFMDAVRRDRTWVDSGNVGTDTYGNLKEMHRARAKQVADIKKRQKEWDAYDAAGGAAVSNNPKPKSTRPTAKELTKARKALDRSTTGFKKFLGDDKLKEFFEPKTPTGKAEDFLSRVRSDITARHPASIEAANNAKRQKLEALAGMFGEKGKTNPRMKALSEDLLTQAQRVGTSGAAPARSQLFKPKKFETFVPSVLHGGMHNTAINSTTPLGMLRYLPQAFSLKQWRKNQRDKSEGYGFEAMRNWFRSNDEWAKHDIAQAARTPGKMYDHAADNLYRHTLNEGSSINPRGYYFGRKGTLWLRPKGPIDPAALDAVMKAEGLKPYAAGNAALGAVGEITGLTNLAKYVPGFNKQVNTCRGHMCGSFPATVYEALGKTRSGIPNAVTLPNRVALSGAFEPLLATNKQLLLKQLRVAGGRRVLLGLGAMGAMGGAGYAGAGALQNAVRGKNPPGPLSVPAVPAPKPAPGLLPTGFPSFHGMGKYAPVAAVGAGGLAALAAANAWGRSRRKKREQAPELDLPGALAPT